MIPHLEAGFALRCFQRLSNPDIATLRALGRTAARPAVRSSRSSRRGLILNQIKIKVSPISRSADYIFSRPAERGRGRQHLTCADSRSHTGDSFTHKSGCLSTQVVTGSIPRLRSERLPTVLSYRDSGPQASCLSTGLERIATLEPKRDGRLHRYKLHCHRVSRREVAITY